MGIAAHSSELIADAQPELPDSVMPRTTQGEPSWRRPARVAAAWDAAWDRATPTRLLVIGLPLIALFMLLTAANVLDQAVLWENGHWTVAGLLAAALATGAAHRGAGTDRQLRQLVALGTGSWAFGQLCWNVQTALGFFSVPAPSDVGFLFLVVPVMVALVLLVRGRVARAEEIAVYLDSGAIFLAISALILALYGDELASYGVLAASVTVAYPILHLATAGAGLTALVATRSPLRLRGGYLLLFGFALLGLSWADWLQLALAGNPTSGSLLNYLFSVGIVLVGLGAAGWHAEPARDEEWRRASLVGHAALPLTAMLAAGIVLWFRSPPVDQIGLVDIAALCVIVITGIRQSMLVHQRGLLLDDAAHAHADLEQAMVDRAVADSRYRLLVERVPAAVYIDVADPDVTDGGHLAYMSPQIESILGYPPEAFVEDPEFWPSLIHPDDRDLALAAYHEHWATQRPLRADYRMIARDGSTIWVHDEAYSMTEAVDGRRVSQGLLVDTTDQKRLQEQLLHDALHDPLTGLANRVLFREHVERALARQRRRRTRAALLFLDLDDFKVVNDSLGHRAGDRLLIEVGRRLSAAIRAGDIVARQGGDEFTILLDRVQGVEDAVASAERLATAIRRPFELEGRSIVIAYSVGIALADHGIEADDLLAHADAAMYAAKAQGKARYAVFDPSMRVRARSRLEMEGQLRTAIDQEAIVLHYQPIVGLGSGRIVGFEALARWPHPDHGLVPPNAFIPLAEETGLIVPLGRLVTRTACHQLKTWIEAGQCDPSTTVSVNVSSRQAVEPGFAADVASMLAESDLPPSSLVLEITESLMLHESTATDGSLGQLRDLGVNLVVDDFGTGFSALEYFKRFAVQGLKIDRSFIDGLGRSKEDTAIVTATLAFASALGLAVTAEGVETTQQLELLRALGCRQAQGYLFARPVPADVVPSLLKEAAALALLSRAS